jgi:WD40 repeat protein
MFTKTDDVISTLEAWNVPADLQMILRDPCGKITAFHLTPDARKLAYAAAKRIGVWELPAGDLIKLIEQPKRDLRLMVVASKAPILAYLMSNNAIGILNYDTSDKPIVIQSPSKWITSMAIAPDGSILATGHSDGVITLWNAESGDQLGYCFDPNSNWLDGKSFEFLDQVKLVYTLPCGSAIPRGAKCTCNCVSGTARVFHRHP